MNLISYLISRLLPTFKRVMKYIKKSNSVVIWKITNNDQRQYQKILRVARCQASPKLLRLLIESDILELSIGSNVSGRKSSQRSKLEQLLPANAILRVVLLTNQSWKTGKQRKKASKRNQAEYPFHRGGRDVKGDARSPRRSPSMLEVDARHRQLPKLLR